MFVLPGVVWLAVFFLIPLVVILIVSLGTEGRDRPHRPVAPIARQLHPGDSARSTCRPSRTRCRYAAITTILSIAIGYPIAYWISRYGGRRKVLLLILVMLPFWTSYLIRTYAWMIILRDNGVLNSILISPSA